MILVHVNIWKGYNNKLMLDDLKNELLSFIKDVRGNMKNEEDLLYVTKRMDQLVDGVLKETEKIMDYKQDQVTTILKKQENETKKLEELKSRVDNLYADIYEEDFDDSFEINCPYCGTEFDAIIDESINEIICPECSNHIELDWNGKPDDEKHGCSGGCSHCGGCE